MINIRTIELIIGFITIAIAYIISATSAGYFQAWAAKKLGDTDPEQAGFLTWNPVVHIDPIGAFCLFFLGVGWGKFVPINPANVHGNFRLLLLFLAKPFAYIFIALSALLALLKVFSLEMLNIAMTMVLSESISLSTLTRIYPESSSLVLAIALILVMLVYIGVLFAVLNLIIGGFRFALMTFLQHLTQLQEGDLLTFLIPFFLLVLLARPLKVLVVYGISHIAYFIAPFIGVS